MGEIDLLILIPIGVDDLLCFLFFLFTFTSSTLLFFPFLFLFLICPLPFLWHPPPLLSIFMIAPVITLLNLSSYCFAFTELKLRFLSLFIFLSLVSSSCLCHFNLFSLFCSFSLPAVLSSDTIFNLFCWKLKQRRKTQGCVRVVFFFFHSFLLSTHHFYRATFITITSVVFVWNKQKYHVTMTLQKLLHLQNVCDIVHRLTQTFAFKTLKKSDPETENSWIFTNLISLNFQRQRKIKKW